MKDTLGAAMIRAYVRNQSCADRGGRCDCMMLCRIDAEEIVADVSAKFRQDVAEIMKRTAPAAEGVSE